MTLRYGVVGAGGVIGPTHLQAIADLSDAELVAVADAVRDPAAERAAAIGAEYVPDLSALLARGVDVVVVCVPHQAHVALGLEALRAGAHVLVEKPLAADVGQAERLVTEAEARRLVAGVVFQQRFSEAVELVEGFVAGGGLGPIRSLSVSHPDLRNAAYYAAAPWRGTWAGEGGAVLVNQGPHVLDLVCSMLGCVPVRVAAWTRARSHAIEAEDVADALLELRDGGVGHLHLATDETGPLRIEALGTRGRVELTRFGPDADGEQVKVVRFDPPLDEQIASGGPLARPRETVVGELTGGGRPGTHLDVHRDFAAAVREGRSPRCSARSALTALELADAMQLAAHGGREVTLPVDRLAIASLYARLAGAPR